VKTLLMLGQEYQKQDPMLANQIYEKLISLKHFEADFMQNLALNYQTEQDFLAGVKTYQLMLKVLP